MPDFRKIYIGVRKNKNKDNIILNWAREYYKVNYKGESNEK